MPTLALLIALVQLGLVYSPWMLSRWKGLGFGMYTELHPKHRQLWALDERGQPQRWLHERAWPKLVERCPDLSARRRRCERAPGLDRCMCALLQRCAPDDALPRFSAVAAYALRHEPEQRVLRREALTRCALDEEAP